MEETKSSDAPLRILTLDAGNSRIKASLYVGMQLQCSSAFGREDSDLLLAYCKSLSPDAAAYCAVGAALSQSVLDAVRDLVDGRFLEVTHSTPLPVGIDYATPLTLGLDRIAAAAAAVAISPGSSVLIVDSGTAITLDVVDSYGCFRGGNISPGLSLRLRALHGYTQALPMVSPAGRLPYFGFDTDSAIRAGVMRGIAYEVMASFVQARKDFGATRLLLSGGDSPLLLPLLDSISDCCVPVADIVGLGLVVIYNYNASC